MSNLTCAFSPIFLKGEIAYGVTLTMKKIVTYLDHDDDQYANLMSVVVHIVTGSNDDDQLLLAIEALDIYLSSGGEIDTVNAISVIGELDVSLFQTYLYFTEKRIII